MNFIRKEKINKIENYIDKDRHLWIPLNFSYGMSTLNDLTFQVKPTKLINWKILKRI